MEWWMAIIDAMPSVARLQPPCNSQPSYEKTWCICELLTEKNAGFGQHPKTCLFHNGFQSLLLNVVICFECVSPSTTRVPSWLGSHTIPHSVGMMVFAVGKLIGTSDSSRWSSYPLPLVLSSAGKNTRHQPWALRILVLHPSTAVRAWLWPQQSKESHPVVSACSALCVVAFPVLAAAIPSAGAISSAAAVSSTTVKKANNKARAKAKKTAAKKTAAKKAHAGFWCSGIIDCIHGFIILMVLTCKCGKPSLIHKQHIGLSTVAMLNLIVYWFLIVGFHHGHGYTRISWLMNVPFATIYPILVSAAGDSVKYWCLLWGSSVRFIMFGHGHRPTPPSSLQCCTNEIELPGLLSWNSGYGCTFFVIHQLLINE